MRFLSTFSMAIALSTVSALAFTAAPDAAFAQKKKKEEAPKLKMSKEVQNQAAEIQKAIAADPATAKPMVEALLAQPLTGDDQFVAGQLAVQIGGALKDIALQEKGLKASLASGSTNAQQLPVYNFYIGNFAYSSDRFAEAIPYLTTAYDLGYRENNIGAVIAEAHFKNNDYPGGLKALDRAIAGLGTTGAKAPEEWYRRGAAMAMQNYPSATAEWTYKLVSAYPTGENWRAALSVYRDASTPALSNQENLELMRLMRNANAMASERDYAEYADAADPRKLPGEVVSVLEEGIAKGDVRATNPYVKDTLASARGSVSGDRASLAASERDSNKSANGKIALATADAFLGYADYKKAAELYQTAITKGGIETPRAQMGLGISRVGQSDWMGAKDAFAQVTGNRKKLADFWTLWIDQQALDNAPAVAATTPSAS